MSIIEWETEALAMVESHISKPSISRVFRTLSDHLVQSKKLPPPDSHETDLYLNQFCPQIIDHILNSGSIPADIEKEYNEILTGFARVAAVFLCEPCEQFLDSAMKIVDNMKAVFYEASRAGVVGREPVLYSTNVQAFARMKPLECFMNGWNKDISVGKVLKVANFLNPVGDYLVPGERSTWGLFVANKLLEMMSNVNVRELNEKEYDAAFAAVTLFVPETVKKRQLRALHTEFAVKLAKCEILSKQMCGMSRIYGLVQEDVMDIGPILQKEGILDFFLKGELHHEIVGYFAEILKALLREDMATPLQVKSFWETALKQHQSVMEKYLKAFSTVADDRMGLFAQIFLDTETCPEQILPILQKLSFNWPKEQLKDAFEKLWKIYNEEKEESTDQKKKELVQTMKMFVASDDVELCEKIQERCFDMIQRGNMPALMLPILESALYNISAERARQYLDVIVSLVDENGVHYLELLVILFRKLGTALSQEDFGTIMEICKKFIGEHMQEICGFIDKLTDDGCAPVPLMDEQMLLTVMEFLCSLGQKAKDVRTLVQKIRDKLNSGQSNGSVGLTALWDMYLKSGNTHILEDLVTTYVRGDMEAPIFQYLDKCIQNIESVRALKAIREIIDVMDPGTNKVMNCFSFDEDMYEVNIVGDVQRQLSIRNDTTYNGLLNILASSLSTESRNIVLTTPQGDRLHAKNFRSYLRNSVYIRVELSYDKLGVVQQKRSQENPVLLLRHSRFSGPLMKVLLDGDPDRCPLVLEILNKMPTQGTELNLLNDFDPELFFCIDAPYLLVYRLHMLANKIKRDPSYISRFCESGGMTILVNIIMNVAHDLFGDDSCELFVTRVANWILAFSESEQFKDSLITQTKRNLSHLLEEIERTADNETSSLTSSLITLLKYYSTDVGSEPRFVPTVKKTLFHKSKSIRKDICAIISNLHDEDQQKQLIIEFLPLSLNSKSSEYFAMICSVVKKGKYVNDLWPVLIDTIYSRFKMPDRENIIEVLKFKQPPQDFTNGLFAVLEAAAERLTKIDDVPKLFEFLTNEIVFNEFKYYHPTKQIWDFYINLMDRDKNLAQQIIPRMKSLQKMPLVQKNEASLSSTSAHRGIRNLGATCYINSTIQQLFHVPEFRRGILSSEHGNDEWFEEFRYAFAKLALFPSTFVDIGNFVQKWRGYDNEVINPRVQQDSVEFLQLLMERLEQKLPHVTDLFKGKIKHTSVTEEGEVSNLEDFVLFPLEVKEYKNTAESLRNFLEPDSFDVVKDGKSERVLRHHRVAEAPSVLIIQLKRFAYDIERGTRLKINSQFEFPMELDLSSVMESKDVSVVYDLVGVVVHTGTAQAGHYFSDVKGISKGKWFCFNDTQVTKIRESSICRDTAGGKEEIQIYDEQYGTITREIEKSSNAYLLFYRKRDESQPRKQLCDTGKDPSLASMEELRARCQEVSDDLIQRLLPEIRDAILRDVVSSTCFANLIMKLCEYDDSGEFLLSHFFNQLRSGCTKDAVKPVVTRLVAVCNKEIAFATGLLGREEELREFVILSQSPVVREAYVDVLVAAASHCEPQRRQQFATRLLDIVVGQMDLLLINFHCFQEFFSLCHQVAAANDLDKWASILVTFLCQSIPSFVQDNKQENMYQSLDLSSLMLMLAEGLTTENTVSMLSIELFKSPIFSKIWIAPCNLDAFANLLSHMLSKSPNTSVALVQAINQDGALSLPTLSKLYAISLQIDSGNVQEGIFSAISKKKAGQVDVFFTNLKESVRHLGSKFAQLSGPWITKFLCSSDAEIRRSFSQFLIAVYTDNKDANVAMFHALNSSFSTLLAIAKRYSAYAKVADEKWPISDYLSVMRSLIKQPDFPKMSNPITRDCVALLRRCVEGGYQSQQVVILNFFRQTYGYDTVSIIPVKELLSVFEGCAFHGNVARAILDVIPTSASTEVIRSKIFSRICLVGFNGSALERFLSQITAEDDAKLVAQNLFTVDCFNNALKHGSSSIFRVSWKLIQKFPVVVNQFEKGDLHLVLWASIRRNNALSRQMAKLLAVFNVQYATLNKGKKSFFKKKTKSLCEGYEEQSIPMAEMFKRAAAKPACKRPGDSGFYELIWSFAVLRKKYVKMLFKHFEHMKPGRLTTLKPPKYGARLLCRVCLAVSTEESLKMIISEFSSITTEVQAVDEFCKVLRDSRWPQTCTQAFLTQLSRLTRHVTDIEIVGPHLADVIVMHWNANQARAIHDNISSLLRAKISIAPHESQTPDDLMTIGTLLKRTFDFLGRLETHFRIPRVNLSSVCNDCAVLASLFNTETATCCFSSLLQQDA